MQLQRRKTLQPRPGFPGLPHRQIEVWLRSLAKLAVLDVFDDADHSHTHSRCRLTQLAADRLPSSKKTPCECLIDDGYGRRLAVVAFGKIASLDERNPHEIEVTRPNRVPVDVHVLAAA